MFFFIVQIYSFSDTTLQDEGLNKSNTQVTEESSGILDTSTAVDLETEATDTNINESEQTSFVSTSSAGTEASKAPVTTSIVESTAKTTTTTKPTQTTPKTTTTTKPKTQPISGNTSYTFRRNENATISIKGNPGTEYMITVIYPSGTASTAEGLESKKADSNGNVSWTWHIGGRTKPGEGTARISGGGAEIKVTFEVVVD